MKILWLTPVHSASAIARFSELVVTRLVERGIDVEVAASETDYQPLQRRSFLDRHISSIADHSLGEVEQDYDAIVANFGDHYPNHARCLKVLGLKRVIGVFHDADMTNFGNGLRAYEGDAAEMIGEASDGRDVTRLIAAQCAGAIAHSAFYLSLLDRCDGPILATPLAWSLTKDFSDQDLGLSDARSSGEFRIVTFGNINSNKCADRIIRAIAASEKLKPVSKYYLLGAIALEERIKLDNLATELGVSVSIEGAVNDRDLHNALREASVVSCLRMPVLEGASASAIEAMLHGCAVLVSDAGFYAELPEDCVEKVHAASEVASLQVVLERMLDDPDARRAMGRRAMAYANDAFSPDHYATVLIRLIDDVRVASVYLGVLDQVAAQLRQLGITADEESAQYLLRAIEEMAPADRRAGDA